MHQPRLQRLDHVYLKQPLYFLTLCTYQRKMILAQSTIHTAFVGFCQQAALRGVYVGRYVLMPDHLHLFVTFSSQTPSLSTWVKSLKNSLSKVWRTASVGAPHWQKNFFDHIMRSTASYEEKWGYVVANPVRAGLVTDHSKWPYQGVINEVCF